MKHTAFTTTIALAAFLTAVPVAFAVDDYQPGRPGDRPSASAGKGGAMDTDQQMTQMQQHMLRMHEQMHNIMQAQDGTERDRLMQEHRQMMLEHMQAMHGMSCDKGTNHGQMGTRKMDDGAQ